VYSPSPRQLVWALTFDNGSSSAVFQSSSRHLRLVRGGQSLDILNDRLFEDRFEATTP